MRLRTSVIAIIAVALMMAGGWAISQAGHDSRTPLAQALDSVPADTRVAGFTDWAGIRTTLGFGTITSAVDRRSLVDNSFKRNLSARSILEDFTEDMNSSYGWSIADVRWEMYAQASKGAVLAAGLEDDLDASTVTTGLRKVGYKESGGIWAIDSPPLGLPGTLTYAAYFKRDKLLYFSDVRGYLQKAAAAHRDHGKTLAGVSSVRGAAQPLIGSLSAVISDGGDSCKDTGVSTQRADVRDQARNIVAPLGTLSSYLYSGRAIFDKGDGARLTFSMTFDSAAVATRQIALRQQLTKGPLVGGTGQLQDVLRLTSTHTNGSTGSLNFDFDPDKASFMNGGRPLLFATCKV